MRELLTFRAGGALFAVPPQALDGVDPLRQVVRVPDAPVFLRGVTNRRGYLVPVVDLSVLLGGGPVPAGEAAWLVVLRGSSAVAGIATDEMPNVVDVPEDAIAAAEGGAAGVLGTVRLPGGQTCTLLDPVVVLDAAAARTGEGA